MEKLHADTFHMAAAGLLQLHESRLANRGVLGRTTLVGVVWLKNSLVWSVHLCMPSSANLHLVICPPSLIIPVSSANAEAIEA